MTKTIVCSECNGFGHINIGCENGTWSVLCDYCNGRGVLRVPMTNADLIRDMSDDELADVIDCPYGSICFDRDCHECSLEWLQRPVED